MRLRDFMKLHNGDSVTWCPERGAERVIYTLVSLPGIERETGDGTALAVSPGGALVRVWHRGVR